MWFVNFDKTYSRGSRLIVEEDKWHWSSFTEKNVKGRKINFELKVRQ